MVHTYLPNLQIPKGSRVILYGAGENGLKVYDQIVAMNWCDILAVLDKNYARMDDFPATVQPPEAIVKYTGYDYVIITITSIPVAEDVEKYLFGLGVDSERILFAYKCFAYSPMVVNTDCEPHAGKHKILLRIQGAIGDNVISLAFYEAVARLADKSVIDIWGEGQWYVKHVFFGLPNLGKVLEKTNESTSRGYDVIIELRFAAKLIQYNEASTRESAPQLAEAIDKLFALQKTDMVDLHVFQYANRVLVNRAKFLGLNRYTLMDWGGIFGIDSKNVSLLIRDGAESHFAELRLPEKYITFNYGAANPLHSEKPQTKQWLPEYHSELNRLLKQQFPDIEIIQTGSKDVIKIKGADRYILGEDLEVTKLMLKNALCHFDCEGGLVHIATQLGTKCFVVFGPTPIWFLGYEQNTNIAPKICGECKGLIPDWYTRCYKGYDIPACMLSIKPDEVFELMKSYLEKKVDRQ